MAHQRDALSVSRGAAPRRSKVVVVAEDWRGRGYLVRLLARGGIETDAAVGRAEELAEAGLEDLAPVVVLSCEAAAAGPALELIRRLAPWSRVVLVAPVGGEADAARAGADLVVRSDEAADVLAGTVLELMGAAPGRAPTPVLSHRERQVLRFALQGLANEQIGLRLSLPAHTVKRHLTAAFVKHTSQLTQESKLARSERDEPIRGLALAPSGDPPGSVA